MLFPVTKILLEYRGLFVQAFSETLPKKIRRKDTELSLTDRLVDVLFTNYVHAGLTGSRKRTTEVDLKQRIRNQVIRYKNIINELVRINRIDFFYG